MISGVLLFKIYNFKYFVNLKAVNWSFLVENSYKILNFSWNLHNELLMSIFFWSSPLWSSAIIEYVPKSISSKRNIVNKGLSNLEKKLFSTNWTGMNFRKLLRTRQSVIIFYDREATARDRNPVFQPQNHTRFAGYCCL